MNFIRFRILISLLAALCFCAPNPAEAKESVSGGIKPSKTTLPTNMVDQSVFYEGTQFLRLDRLYRKVFRKKTPSLDINVYDEVPDSALFVNRHARTRLTPEALEKGYFENNGPSAEGSITILKGKTEGLHPGFFIQDSRGDRYLLKFDPLNHLELNTSAEVIASRFYHAIGYHVPQYTVFSFDPARLVPGPKATMVDRSGFKKALTAETLAEFLSQLPQDGQGRLRASASKILQGENKGDFKFQGLRRDDPEDKIPHDRLRPIRTLAVFAALINNNDVRRQNTLDMWVTENGKSYLKHYLIDFNAAFGAAAGGEKPPMFTHEYFLDYGEITKNIFSLGFREEPWRKRLRENNGEGSRPSSLGYLDNIGFSADRYKVQLPHYAFKDISRADGFWAAKIILSFRDEDLAAMIRSGLLSNPEDAAYLLKITAERRDLIGRYWLSRSSPFENFNLTDGRLNFTDLETHYGFLENGAGLYSVEGFLRERSLGRVESFSPEIVIPEDWLTAEEPLTLQLRVMRPDEKKNRPFVELQIQDRKITRALHQD